MVCSCEISPENDLRIDIEQNYKRSLTKNLSNLFQPESRCQSSYAYVLWDILKVITYNVSI